MADDSFFRRLSEPCPYPAGTRIRLVAMPDDPDPIPVGTEGTVVGGSGAQLWVEWDNGRKLNLDTIVDRWRVIS